MSENSKRKRETAGTPEQQAAVVKTLQDAGIPAVLPPAPADRIRMVTWEGHEYSVDPTVLDDIEVLEILADMDEQPQLLAKLLKIILGDQWEGFKQNHKDESGRLSVTRVGEFMNVLNAEITALGN